MQVSLGGILHRKLRFIREKISNILKFPQISFLALTKVTKSCILKVPFN